MYHRSFLLWAVLVVVLAGCTETPRPKTQVQEQKGGTFVSIPGEEGEAGFGAAYLAPPSVDLMLQKEGALAPVQHTIVVEVTAGKFKWKNAAKKGDPNATEKISWRSFGMVERN
jgi:hypothetical protein